MGMQILCNYMCHDEATVTYAFGAVLEDITGVIRFNLADGSYEIVKWPEKTEVCPIVFRKLCSKYQADFANRIFKDKIAFQS